MAKGILILGYSGSGKSTSGRTLDPQETFWINCDQKELPFKGSSKMYQEVFNDEKQFMGSKSNLKSTTDVKDIVKTIGLIANKKPNVKVIVVDTITHVQSASVMNRINETGYKKYDDFAAEVRDMIKSLVPLRKDLFVIFMAHIESIETSDGGGTKRLAIKVPAGALTRKVVDPESLFTVVLGSIVTLKDNKSEGFFITKGDEKNPYKSPMGMFKDTYIPNDLKYVVECAKAYYDNEEAPEAKKVDKAILKSNDESF
jgi:hypothetical protein